MIDFAREDWTLFRNVSTLGQKAGVAIDDLPALLVKELADNGLDTGAEVTLGALKGGCGFFVADNGRGLGTDPDRVAYLFSIKRPLRSTKLLRMPLRGALGNGLRVVAGAVLATEGSLVVHTGGRRLELVPRDDGTTVVVSNRASRYKAGTRIEVVLGAPFASLPFGQYRHLADIAIQMAGGGKLYKGKPSPHWFCADSFYECLDAAQDVTVRGFLEGLDGCTGAKAGEIAGPYRGRLCAALNRNEAAEVLERAQEAARPVSPARLGFVGPNPEFGVGYYRNVGELVLDGLRGGVGGAVPFVVEAWGTPVPAEISEVLICINRTPTTAEVILARQDDDRTAFGIYGCDLRHAVTLGKKPLAVRVNLISPHVPITSDGKEPCLEPFVDVLVPVIERAAKSAQRQRTAVLGRPSRSTLRDAIFDNIQWAMAKASGNGEYRFSLRQLFYACRTPVMEAMGSEPGYGYFTQLVDEYEAENGDIAGMYRDVRGSLYHPHLRQEIPLGTKAVEEYVRPPWVFNKLIYCEKEGFVSILREAGWPERHDCALVSAKGYASRAVKDLIDLLGETEEDLLFFCVHDADADGTRIYETLQEATLARPGRRVQVINLGLDPEESIAMGLEVEEVTRKRKAAVASYVDEDWAEWLQSNRVELNAMDTPQFIAWLDEKIAPYTEGKVVPPEKVLAANVKDAVTSRVRAGITAEILKEAGLEGRVDRAWGKLKGGVRRIAGGPLARYVVDRLDEKQEHSWRAVVDDMAARLLGDSSSEAE